MTRTDILIRFIKKSIVPIITAILLYNLFAGLLHSKREFELYVSFNALRNTFRNTVYVSHCRSLSAIRAIGIFMTAANIAIGAVIGGIILIWKLLVAVCYVPYTAVKLITA